MTANLIRFYRSIIRYHRTAHHERSMWPSRVSKCQSCRATIYSALKVGMVK